MDLEEFEVAALMAEEGRDCALKQFPTTISSDLPQALDPHVLTSLGVVVWAAGSVFSPRFADTREGALEC